MLSIRPVSSEASHPSRDDGFLDDLLLDRLDDLSFFLPFLLEELRPLVLLFFLDPSLRDPDPDEPIDLGLLLRLPPLPPPFLLDDLDDAGLSDFLSRSVRPADPLLLRDDAAPMAGRPGLTDRAIRLPSRPMPLARSLPRASAGDLDRDLGRLLLGFSGGGTRSRERTRPVGPWSCRNIWEAAGALYAACARDRPFPLCPLFGGVLGLLVRVISPAFNDGLLLRT